MRDNRRIDLCPLCSETFLGIPFPGSALARTRTLLRFGRATGGREREREREREKRKEERLARSRTWLESCSH